MSIVHGLASINSAQARADAMMFASISWVCGFHSGGMSRIVTRNSTGGAGGRRAGFTGAAPTHATIAKTMRANVSGRAIPTSLTDRAGAGTIA